MKTSHEQMPDPEDMFSDTRMTFGEHIEDLRRHLLRAIYGFCIGMLIAFIIGKPVLRFIARPVEQQLMAYWERYNDKKIEEVREAARTGQYGGRPFRLPIIKIDVNELGNRLAGRFEMKHLVREPQLDFTPVFLDSFKKLGLDEAFDKKLLSQDRWMYLQPEAAEFAESMAAFDLLMKPPQLSTLSIQEGFVVFFKVCLMTGFVIASPWVFFQIWSFVAAGLYPHEKRLVNVYMPFSLALFLAGVFVCEAFVLPKAVEALLWFNEWLGLQPDLRLSEWLGFAIIMPLIFGVSFQTPLVMLFVERIGVVDVETFKNKRKMAILLIHIFAAVITPSTDPVSMELLAIPMCLLYELGIILVQLQPRPPFEELEMEESEEMVEV